MLKKILSKISYTYRIRHGFGLEIARNDRELKALRDFCLRTDYGDDISRQTLFITTAREIDSHLLCGNHHFAFGGKDYYSVHSLIEEYSGWYWD